MSVDSILVFPLGTEIYRCEQAPLGAPLLHILRNVAICKKVPKFSEPIRKLEHRNNIRIECKPINPRKVIREVPDYHTNHWPFPSDSQQPTYQKTVFPLEKSQQLNIINGQ